MRNFGQPVRHFGQPPASYGNPVAVAGLGLGVAAFVAIAAVPTFIINPWIVKAFAPDWSYGRRLGASFGFMLGVSALTGLVRAASSQESSNA